jgi:D-sedoheptulose 7-phosphate isomerase
LFKKYTHSGLPAIRRLFERQHTLHTTSFRQYEGYDKDFFRTVKAQADAGDSVAISGRVTPEYSSSFRDSKKSWNDAIGLSGFKGGKMIELVDIPINIDTDSIERVEDIHMICDHVMTMVMRESLQR